MGHVPFLTPYSVYIQVMENLILMDASSFKKSSNGQNY